MIYNCLFGVTLSWVPLLQRQPSKEGAWRSPHPSSSFLSIHDTFLKLCPPGKYYKEATLTMDQVSSLPALRVSPGWWEGWRRCPWNLLRWRGEGGSEIPCAP